MKLATELKTNNSIIYQLDKIVERLRKYIPVSKIEKKSFGEVFTPFELVNEMLDTLPVEVWSNPHLKWADLCNGTGNFMIIIIKRLMIGLESLEPNESKRYKHIVENMIYVAELQVKNMFLWMLSIDPKSKLNINIYRGDSLHSNFDKHMKEVWKVEKFDIIVGNPPYNDGGDNKGSAHVLWNKFVKNAIDFLSESGYLLYIHPSGWRDVDGGFKNIQNIIKNRHLIYIEIHNEKDGMKTFGAETRYDFYCLKNIKNIDFLTTIKFQDGTIGKINIHNLEFIPNSDFDILQKLLPNNNEETVSILYDCSYHIQNEYVSKHKTIDFKYPCVYMVPKDGIPKLRYSKIMDKGHFGIPKVIWSNGRIISVGSFIDMDGQYGMNQFSYAIVDDPENLIYIKRAFDSKKFRSLMESCSMANMSINRKVIATFKKDFWKEFIDENDPE